MERVKFEKIPQRSGLSWRHFIKEDCRGFCQWHYHNEFELVLHRYTEGTGYVGHYQGELGHNTLWLIAPNTPHSFNCVPCDDEHPPARHSLWLKRDWLANMMFSCLELRKLESVFKRAEKGIGLSTESGEQAYQLLKDLTKHSHINQLAILLQILGLIADDKQTTTLLSFSNQSQRDTNTKYKYDRAKIEKLSQFIEDHYHQPITLADLALQLNTSESSVHRIFEAHFYESFSQYLKKIRLNHAAELLISTDLPISLVAEKVGYHNQANFNRLFKGYKKTTPRQYRCQFGQQV